MISTSRGYQITQLELKRIEANNKHRIQFGAIRMVVDPIQLLPSGWQPDGEVIKGVIWGRPEWVPSPAYWAILAATADEAQHGFSDKDLTLAEEVGFCLLGGYGITAELNKAYFDLLRDEGVFEVDSFWSAEGIESLLRQPVQVDGRARRYRFPVQKSARISHALKQIKVMTPQLDNHLAFRRDLMAIPGIGPKTASWIVRNWLGSDEVAILDIHVLRAGELIGLFDRYYKLPRDYERLERRFLDFCDALEVPASLMDAIIWTEMRELGRRVN